MISAFLTAVNVSRERFKVCMMEFKNLVYAVCFLTRGVSLFMPIVEAG